MMSEAILLLTLDKGIKTTEKEFFSNILKLLYSAREKVLSNLKSRLFPIKNLDKIPTHETTHKQTTELPNTRNVN